MDAFEDTPLILGSAAAKTDDCQDNTRREEGYGSNSSSSIDGDASYWGLWQHHREYRWYLLSSLVTDAGEWFSYIASIAAIEQIHSANNDTISRTSISILVALRLLPNALFNNFGGVLADSYDRRDMLLVLDILSAFIVCFLLLAYQFKSIPAIYFATVCQMTAAAMYEPARSALIPMLIIDERYLKKALTMTGLAWSIMACVGASAGGLVTEYFGINKCFLIDSATYLLSAVFIWRIRGKYTASKPLSGVCEQEMLASISTTDDNLCRSNNTSNNTPHLVSMSEALNMTIDGFNYLRSKPWGSFVFLKGCAGLIYGAAEILNVAYSEKAIATGENGTDINLDGSREKLGMIFASVGVGCFIGPVISEKLTDMDKTTTLEIACLVSYLLMGIGYLGMALIEGFISVCIFSSIRAAGSNMVWIYSTLLLQKFCSNDMLGRVMGVDYALATLSEALAAMAGGVLQDNAGMSPEQVSFVMAIVAFATLVLWTAYFCWKFKSLEPDKQSQEKHTPEKTKKTAQLNSSSNNNN